MNDIQPLFEGEITEQQLKELRLKYPSDMKVDMSNDDEFKDARKIRTEKNKLVKAINDRRIEVTGQLKEYGDSLVDSVEKIYDVVVIPFEKEDKRRKAEAEKKKKEREALLAKELEQIKEIKGFVESAKNSSSEEIQGVIEAVDLIDVSIFDKEHIHEAITTKQDTLDQLANLLESTISQEKIELERKENKIKDKIANLKLIPTGFFDKTSTEIQAKIDSLESFEIKQDTFLGFTNEAKETMILTLTQLKAMKENALIVENAKIEAEKTAQEKIKNEEVKQAQEVAESSSEVKEIEEKPTQEKLEDAKEVVSEQPARRTNVKLTPIQMLENWSKMHEVSEQAMIELRVLLKKLGLEL